MRLHTLLVSYTIHTVLQSCVMEVTRQNLHAFNNHVINLPEELGNVFEQWDVYPYISSISRHSLMTIRVEYIIYVIDPSTLSPCV